MSLGEAPLRPKAVENKGGFIGTYGSNSSFQYLIGGILTHRIQKTVLEIEEQEITQADQKHLEIELATSLLSDSQNEKDNDGGHKIHETNHRQIKEPITIRLAHGTKELMH